MVPGKLPTHLNIVAVESHYCSIPEIRVPPGYTFTLSTYFRSTPSEVAERIRDADIVITTTACFTAAALSATNAPRLRMITAMAVGTDAIDLAACAARSITVLNSPNCNTATVAEHALALYLAVRRGLVPSMQRLERGEWAASGTLVRATYAADAAPRTLKDEVVAVVGFGAVGRYVAQLFSGLGCAVVVAARKGAAAVAEGRVEFGEALERATVVVLCCPRVAETEGLMGTDEFRRMRRDAVLVNVARGGVVREEALLAALQSGEIAGAGVDVFTTEPAGPGSSVLVGVEGVNLVMTPHTAWISMDTVKSYQRVCQENIVEFIEGRVREERVVV
ncbi:hypothetical protein TD95_000211 [Thielaviopsis punctulata]|uniref:Glycerate dehydrogenase n=1 Tax=Thielaviopsis punctulata TaxID=72032 RepID=A0A0F4ZES1_9PEZI|nr:hypothetical protein TD95_000211 [Thielaviopsis punctulata]